MGKKKDDVINEVDVTNEVDVAEQPTEEQSVAIPAYDVVDKYKDYVGIIVGTKIIEVKDGKVIADDELHKTLVEGGFIK